MNRRGISDLIGFSLMFSIIIIGVALVSTAGFAQLSELSQQEQIGAAERGMEAFAANLDAIARQGDPARSIQLAPSGGLLWFNESRVTIDVGGDTLEYDVNSLEHRFSRGNEFASVNYDTGAVTRSDGGLPTVYPRWRCDDNADPGSAVVTLVTLTAGDGLSLGSGFGSGTGFPNPPRADEIPQGGDLVSTERTVTFEVTHQDTTVEYRNVDQTDEETVEIDVSGTANPLPWTFGLDRADGWGQSGDYSYTCDGVETVIIRNVTVELSAST